MSANIILFFLTFSLSLTYIPHICPLQTAQKGWRPADWPLANSCLKTKKHKVSGLRAWHGREGQITWIVQGNSSILIISVISLWGHSYCKERSYHTIVPLDRFWISATCSASGNCTMKVSQSPGEALVASSG